MQLACIVPASIVVLFSSCSVRRGDRELSGDLVEGVLGCREPELALEQRRFGGIPVGAGQVQSLGGVDELLCLLHYVCKVGEHD